MQGGKEELGPKAHPTIQTNLVELTQHKQTHKENNTTEREQYSFIDS